MISRATSNIFQSPRIQTPSSERYSLRRGIVRLPCSRDRASVAPCWPEVVTTSRFKGAHSRHDTLRSSDLAMERPADHIPLLLRRQSNEVYGIAGHADCELRVLVRVLDGVFERFPVDDVQVHVEAAAVEIEVERLGGLLQKLPFGQMRLLWRNGDGIADTVLRVLVGKLGNGQAGCKP